MPRRTIAFVVFAAVIALACIRLGFWQLSRLRERQARNAVVAARLLTPPVAFREVVRDSASARYRKVRATGRFDYANEVILASRSRNGAPGVHLLTPLIVAEGEPAILVNRGWVYSGNGMDLDRARWREGDTAVVEGFVESFTSGAGPVVSASRPRVTRSLRRDAIAAMVPYPLAPFVIVQRLGADQTGEVNHPHRLDLPTLDEGAHMGYALQWFAFALIAVAGTAVVVTRRRAAGAPAVRLRTRP